MNDTFGTGVALPVAPGSAGELLSVRDAELVQQSIRIILSTSPGERVMRPDFGCRIRDYVFAIPDAATLADIGAAVKDALVRWEPRIDLDAVDVVPHLDDARRLEVRIAYHLRATDDSAGLVYPIELA